MTTDWKAISVKLRDALAASEKFWEHRDLLRQVNDLLMDEEERTPLKWIGLPTGVQNALMRSGCDTIEKLVKLRKEQILSIRGIGERSIPVIARSIKNWNSVNYPAGDPLPFADE